jgi:hypothetical protein
LLFHASFSNPYPPLGDVVFFIGALGDVVFSMGVGVIGPGFSVMLADAVRLLLVDSPVMLALFSVMLADAVALFSIDLAGVALAA